MNRTWVRRMFEAPLRGLLLAVMSLACNIPLFVLWVVLLGLSPLGIGVVALPYVTKAVRRVTNTYRRLSAEWSGMPIAVPYRPAPPGAEIVSWRRYQWIVTDPATWRDLLWLLAAIPVGAVLGLLAFCLVFYGVEGVLLVPSLVVAVGGDYAYAAMWPVRSPLEGLLSLPQGAVILAVGRVAAPWLLRLHAEFTRSLLAPTRAASLALRVRSLTDSRAETVDSHAAELRRIERDLHDGAQARLVALSMSVGLAEEVVDRDPELARRLLAEARESSGQALAELRGLVRGIHPPVLAERGLVGAVEALAMAVPLRVHVDADLPGRPQAPVESAVYFAVAEALTNVAKHSRARTASVRLSNADGRLVAVVADDGVGGADPDRGSGLRGIRRRLAVFDGTLEVTSPPGGPTVVTMELPCALSSPRTSPSCGTD